MKKKYWNIILILVLTVFVLYFSLKDNYDEIISILLNADIRWLLFGYILVVSYTFLKSIVTNNIINNFKPYTIIKTFQLQMMTFFFNAITPFSTGGQPFQIYALNKGGLKISESSNVIIQESIIHQIAVIIVGLLTLLLNAIFNICDMNNMIFWLLLFGFLSNLLVLVFLFILSYGKKMDNVLIKFLISILAKLHIIKNKEQKLQKWQKSIDMFNIGSKTLLSNGKKFIKLILLNCLSLICLYIVPLLVLFSFNNYTAFNGIEAIVICSFVSLISGYIPLPGGTGGQEYLFVLLFGSYVINPMLGSLMIMWRFLTYYFPMIVGGIIFNFYQNKKEKI